MPKIFTMIFLIFLSASSSAQEGTDKSNTGAVTKMPGHQMTISTEKVNVKAPRVPFKFGRGMKKYRDMCAKCHGKWGDGTEQGPPLIHPFYKPSHHGDPAFYQAVLRGVTAHHWKFGNMPPVEGATSKDVDKIVPFIRWLQKENGVF